MYSVDWLASVVTIPKADTVLVSAGPPEIRQLDIEDLWRNLRALEASEAGVGFPDQIGNPDGIVVNLTPRLLAGVTYGREIQIVNGFRLEFEDGSYSVNIVGGNSNVADVRVPNNVSVNTANSAGVVEVPSAALSAAEALMLAELYRLAGLEAGAPVLHQKEPAEIQATGISLALDETPGGDVTVTRQ